MFNGAFALLERSLRVDSRAWSTHLGRLGLLGAIYLSLCYALATAFMVGAPGLRFFETIAYLDATFMTLLGVGFFATSITEEKEEDTLGLMLMAGISPLGILMGKSGGRLWQALLLIAVQYPFVLLAVTMGGVMGTQVWAVTIALLAYMVFLAGFGLLCSTLAPRSQTAVTWMVVGLFLYFVVPMIAQQISSAHTAWLLKQGTVQNGSSAWWTVIGAISEVCVFLQLSQILATGFSNTAFGVQVITNVLAGVLCAGLAWLLFGVGTRNVSTEATSRGLIARSRRLSPFFAGRAWRNPFLWKDFHFVAGGVGMMLARFVYYAGLGIFALSIEGLDDGFASEWFGSTIFLIWISVPIDAARVISRCNQAEIRGQTLASLMMLPRSTTEIVYAKTAGVLMAWLPGPIIALMVTLISPQLRQGLGEMITQNDGLLVMAMFVLYFALIPHFASLMSMYVRWGAVALGIALTIGVYIGLMMAVMIFGTFFAPFFAPGSQSLIFAGISFVFLCLCVACHIGVLLRFQSLAAKG